MSSTIRENHEREITLMRFRNGSRSTPAPLTALTYHSAIILPQVAILAAVAAMPSYQLDPNFAPSFTTKGNAENALPLNDGRLMVSGWFSLVNHSPHSGVVRLDPDGAVDQMFQTEERYSLEGVQPDGKVLVWSSSNEGIVRLNQDGTPDTSFHWALAEPLKSHGGYITRFLGFLKNGDVLEYSSYSSPSPGEELVLLDSTGAIKTELKVPGVDRLGAYEVNYVGSQPSGAFVISLTGLSRELVRFNMDGTFDRRAPVPIKCCHSGDFVLMLEDGGMLAGNDEGFTKLGPDLVKDSNFFATFQTPRQARAISGAAALRGGDVLAWGSFTNVNGAPILNLVRLGPSGSVRLNFKPDPEMLRLLAIATQEPRIVATEFGDNVVLYSLQTGNVVQLTPGGALLSSTSPRFEAAGQVQQVITQADGNIIVFGEFTSANRVPGNLVRLNADGTLDNALLPQTRFYPRSIALQSDGKLLVADDEGITRVLVNGFLAAGYFDQVAGSTRIGMARFKSPFPYLHVTSTSTEQLVLGVAGPGDRILRIESSLDLKSWSELTNVVSTGSETFLPDMVAPQRFYRAAVPRE